MKDLKELPEEEYSDIRIFKNTTWHTENGCGIFPFVSYKT